MRLFAIHTAVGPTDIEGLEGARAARTGFSFAALVFGPLWLLARGVWLALAGYLLAAVGVAALAGYGVLRPGAVLALFALGQIYLAFEGRALAVIARARNGRPLVDVIFAQSALEAEKIYLERALAAAPATERRPASRVGDEIMGSSPEAGR